MGLIPQEKILEVKEAFDIVDIVSNYVSLKKAGLNFKGLCPFHVEKTPSLIVSPAKQIFHCFGCGVGGNVFHFVSKVQNLSFIDTVRFLADKKGIRLETVESGKQDIKEEIFKLSELAAKFYKEKLKETKIAQEYIKKRNISNETVERFAVGFAPNEWDSFYNYAKRKNIQDSIIEKSGIAIKRENKEGYYDRFRNRIIFPILNNYGRVAAFGARVLDDSLPKYINSPETPVYIKGKNLFGWYFAKDNIAKNNYLIIVEGYFDCIACHQFGITNVVATLGTALTKEQVQFIKRYTDNVVIAYDVDLAGIAASIRGIDLLIEEGLNVKVAEILDGKDPDEVLNKKGKEAFVSAINRAKEIVDFWLDHVKKESLSDIKAKAKLLDQILPVVAKVQDDNKRSEYRKIISQRLDLKEQFLLSKLNEYFSKIYKISAEEKPKTRKNAISKYESAERDLLKLVLSDNKIAERVKDEVFSKDFSNTIYRKLIEFVFEHLSYGDKVDYSSILNSLEEDLSKTLRELLLAKDEFTDKEKAERDLVGVIRESRIKKRLIELEPEVNKILRKSGIEASKEDKELVNEYQQLQRYLKGNKGKK